MSQNQTPKKLNLKVGITNFGPISKGTLDLKPLTIFVGPNNSGKSYAAMLVHALFGCVPNIDLVLDASFYSESIPQLFKKQNIQFKEAEKLKNALLTKTEITIDKNLIYGFFAGICTAIYEINFPKKLARFFITDLKNLVTIGKRKIKISLESDNNIILISCYSKKFKMEKYHISSSTVTAHISNTSGNKEELKNQLGLMSPIYHVMVTINSSKFKKVNELPIYSNDLNDKEGYIRLYWSILDWIIKELFRSEIEENFHKTCSYLPAARSGILQGHKALSASIIQQSPFAGLQSNEMLKLSGVVADFLSNLLTLPEEKGPFYDLASELEQELIGGEIRLVSGDEIRYPEIRYRFRKKDISLHRASSTVSETAPLILYLKYLLKPGEMVIIEEPEAHLHPQNQRVLAKYLVRMIRAGLNVLITTHSDLLIDQLSNYLMLSGLDKDRRIEKYTRGSDDYLTPDEVSAHVFGYDDKSGGYIVSNVEISKEDGISQEEHLKIHESLYEETYRIRRDLED